MKTPSIVIGLFAFAALLSLARPVSADEPISREVEFKRAGEFRLKGTLLLPSGDSGEPTWPAALLLPGSGPTDRNGNQPPMMMTNVLKQIAEHLAANGVASLRFDKRSCHAYASDWPSEVEKINDFFSYENFIADAKAAFEHLAQQPGIDPSRVAILGHSEGGLFALQIAHDLKEAQPRPAGLILAATAGRTLDVVLVEQVRALLDLQTQDEALKADLLQQVDRAIEQVKRNKTVPDDLHAGLRALFNPAAAQLLHAYFTVDPAALAKSVRGPVLIVQGDMDAQISAERDAPVLREALAARDHGEVTLEIVANASHCFKQVRDRRDPGLTGSVAGPALDAISRWCAAHLKATPQQREPN